MTDAPAHPGLVPPPLPPWLATGVGTPPPYSPPTSGVPGPPPVHHPVDPVTVPPTPGPHDGPSLWDPVTITDVPEVSVEHAARLDVTDLSMWFGGRKVLERCSLSVEPTEVTALIGPSGCGKSTFLRALNRMHELVPGAALSGRGLLDGLDIYSEETNATEVRLRIGMVFQKPNPFPAMSIADNVLAGLGLAGISVPDPDELVETCLRRAGLWNEVKDRLGEGGMSLSGGQQQRLCIARSLAVSPDVLLMDQPCSALHPISTRVIEETIRELCHDITIVIVTHNMQQAQRVSDQCAFFLVEELGQPGRIIEVGDTQRMFSDPSDPRTLDYVSGRFG